MVREETEGGPRTESARLGECGCETIGERKSWTELFEVISEMGVCDHHGGYQGAAPERGPSNTRRDDLASQHTSNNLDCDWPFRTLPFNVGLCLWSRD